MLSNYKRLYYLLAFLGLFPFSYKIINNEISFSFPRSLKIYCYLLLTLSVLSKFSFAYLKCYESMFREFLTGIFTISYFCTWLFDYLNNFYYTKELTTILKDIYTLEVELKTIPKRNLHFNIFCWQKAVLFGIIIGEDVLQNYYSKWIFGEGCRNFSFLDYFGCVCTELNYVFILCEMQNLLQQCQIRFKFETKLTNDKIKDYAKILLKFKRTYKKTNSIYQIPALLQLGMNFSYLLLSFNIFINFATERIHFEFSWNNFTKFIEFNSVFVWVLNGLYDSVLLVYYVEKCEAEVFFLKIHFFINYTN